MNDKEAEKPLKRRQLFAALCTLGVVGTALVQKKDDIVHAAPQEKSASQEKATSLQEGWRWCNKCQGLFYAGNGGSVCPAGGSHNPNASGAYGVILS